MDVLVHEAVDPDFLRAKSTDRVVTEKVIAHHTTGGTGRLFTRVTPRLAVYSHAPGRKELIEQTRKTYSGPLQGPENLLRIDVGAQIVVERLPR